MTQAVPTVVVVDDDPFVRKGLARLIKSAGYHVEVFAGGEEFLKHLSAVRPSCLVLDVCMPGISGFEIPKKLARRGISLPYIFITGNGDIDKGVQAIKGGAVGFLSKPFEDSELLAAIEKAIGEDFRFADP